MRAMKMRRRRLLLPKPLPPLLRLRREVMELAARFVRDLPLRPLPLQQRHFPESIGPTVAYRPGWRSLYLQIRRLVDDLPPN